MSEDRIIINIEGMEVIDEYVTKLDTILGRTASGVTGGVGRTAQGGLTNAELRRLSQDVAYVWASQRPEVLARSVFEAGRFTDRNLRQFGDFMRLNDQMIKRQAPLDAILASSFPSFNREERIILNQILPSGALRNYYNIKRLQGGLNLGGYQTSLAVVATGLILLQEIRRIQRQLKIDEEDYKKIFLEYKPDLTKDEFQDIKDQSTNNWTRFLNYVFRGA